MVQPHQTKAKRINIESKAIIEREKQKKQRSRENAQDNAFRYALIFTTLIIHGWPDQTSFEKKELSTSLIARP